MTTNAGSHQSDSDSFIRDDKDFLWPRCTCGWTFGPVPDLETFVDVLMAHAADAVSDAVEELERALHQHGHIVELQETRFALEHPVGCRAAGLLNCSVDRALDSPDGPPKPPGRYPVHLTEHGLVIGEALRE